MELPLMQHAPSERLSRAKTSPREHPCAGILPAVKKFAGEFLVSLLYRLGICHAVLWLERWLGPRRHILVVRYHHLQTPDDAEAALSSLASGLPLADFERQIRWLRQWYAPVNVGDLERILDGRQELRQDSFLVTFDDGYLDNRTLGGPVLRRHGVPGLVFIPTGAIEGTHRFWWARAEDVLRRISPQDWKRAAGQPVVPENVRRVMSASAIDVRESRRSVCEEIVETLGGLDAAQQNAALDQMERFAPSQGKGCLPLLQWSQMREMETEGFAFGAHTHTHPKLSHVPPDQVRYELMKGAKLIWQHLRACPRSFAYPSGDYSPWVAEQVARAGFRLAFTTKPGVISPGKTPRYELPRISIWRSAAKDVALALATLKLIKYFPRLMLPLASRLMGDGFTVCRSTQQGL